MIDQNLNFDKFYLFFFSKTPSTHQKSTKTVNLFEKFEKKIHASKKS